MEQNYDMEALYLYSDDWKYRVGKIAKVNDKSIRMEYGIKISKEDFKNIHKLTDDEINIFKKQLVKKLSNTNGEIKNIINSINCLKTALQCSELTCVNSDKLQGQLDLLSETISKELSTIFEIDCKKFEFNECYSERLSEVE